MQITTRVGVVQAIGRLPYRVSEQEERKVRGAAAQAPGARLGRKEIILGAPPRRPAEAGDLCRKSQSILPWAALAHAHWHVPPIEQLRFLTSARRAGHSPRE